MPGQDMKLDIPFIHSRGFECGQTCAAMMIKYYYPDFKPDFKEFNRIIHHVAGKYTFPHQNVLLLDYYNLKAKCYSSEDLKTSKEDPTQFRRWFGKEYNHQIKFIDIPTYDKTVITTRQLNLFEKHTTFFSQVLDIVNQKYLVSVVLDWTTLSQKSGPYSGHFMLISGIDSQNIYLHDPDSGPYQKYPHDLVQRAYSHPAITHDLIIAFGKK